MTKLPSRIIKVFLAMLVFCSIVFSQTDRTMPVIPCPKDDSAGRPTLKRRQPIPDNPRDNESDQAQSATEEKPCTVSQKTFDSALDQDSATVSFEGLHAFSESDVLKLFRQQPVDLTQDRLFDRGVLGNAVAALRELFLSHGYQQAIVEARADEHLRSITFFVGEGPRSQIAEIVFEGNRVFSSQDLATRMREYLNRYDSSKNGYDAEILDYCMHELADFVRSKGYLQAKFGEPNKTFTDRGLIITINVDEGVLYRFGDMTIEGATVFSPEQVKAMLSLQPGDIADGEALSKWLFEDLKKAYGEKGYIQYTAEVTPEFKEDQGAGVVNLKIDIDEGSLFKIRKIEFIGTNLQQEELRRLLLISEGGVFNQSLFDDSVRKLNETGWFEYVDKDKDADFKTNDEEGLLDVAIKLTRKNSPDSLSPISDSHAGNLRP